MVGFLACNAVWTKEHTASIFRAEVHTMLQPTHRRKTLK